MSEITLLLEQAYAGDHTAWERVVELLHDDLLRLARCASTSGRPDSLDAPALVRDCYERVAGEIGRHTSGVIDGRTVINRSHFLALAGRAMRQILVSHARTRVADVRTGESDPATAEALREAAELLDLDAVLEEFGHEDERLVRVVDGRIFGGLSEVEIAEALRLPLRTVQRLWDRARERLRSLPDT